MAKHYEALQRAEAERKRKAGLGPEPSGSAAVGWDTTPHSAPKPKRRVRKLFRNASESVSNAEDSANELNKRRVAILQPESFASEQFRMLRGRIDALATQQKLQTVAVTSANPGEGKSTASINLAVVTAMSVGRKVLLVDCDLRRPKVHKTLGLAPQSGLAEVLLQSSTFEDSVINVDSLGLDVLCVRSLPGNPSELLASAQMKQMLAMAAEVYDQIILDTPACLGLPDSKTISELSDGILVIVRADVTRKEDVDAVLEILDRRRLIGMVLNGVEASGSQYGYY
ncbi:MAG: capsular biosynthesis protein [Deltaproteobacteria bacterium]|nr:capsular biosynthesis protein [Deltaproteobacteria bacterium]